VRTSWTVTACRSRKLVEAFRPPADDWRDALIAAEQAEMQLVRVSKCGTQAGYVGHQKNGEEPCDPCRAAKTEYDRARWRKSHPVPRIAKCGTPSGANRHRRLNEEVCSDCRAAEREYRSRRKEQASEAPDRL